MLVTGASRGIGRAIAARLVGEGKHVVGVARHAPALEETRRVLGTSFDHVVADLAHGASAQALVAGVVERFGTPRAFVSAAGIAEYGAALEVTDEAMRRHFEVHVVGALALIRALATRWIADGTPGAVVAISSTLATKPAPFTLPYAVAKAALEAAVRGLALELAPHAIRVNAVSPGVVDTAMTRGARPDGSDADERLRALAERHPLGRLGTAEEVAATVAHVLSAEFMTGSIVVLDGGLALT